MGLLSGFFHSLSCLRRICVVTESPWLTFTSRALVKDCSGARMADFWSQPHHVPIASHLASCAWASSMNAVNTLEGVPCAGLAQETDTQLKTSRTESESRLHSFEL